MKMKANYFNLQKRTQFVIKENKTKLRNMFSKCVSLKRTENFKGDILQNWIKKTTKEAKLLDIKFKIKTSSWCYDKRKICNKI